MIGKVFLLSCAASVPAVRASDGCENYILITDRGIPRAMSVDTPGGPSKNLAGTYDWVSNVTFERSDPPMLLRYADKVWQFTNGTGDGPKSEPCNRTNCSWPFLAKWPLGSPRMHPLFSMVWRPSLSTLAEKACAAFTTSGIMSKAHTLELARGLGPAANLTALTFDFRPTLELDMPAMRRVLASVLRLPVRNLTLWTTEREEWPTGASAEFARAAPAAAAVVLGMHSRGNSSAVGAALSSFVEALPSQTRLLRLNLQSDALDRNTARTLAGAFGQASRFRRLDDISIDVSNALRGADFTSADKVLVFKSLHERGYKSCGLTCNNITDMSNVSDGDQGIAALVCAGHGNCNNPHGPGYIANLGLNWTWALVCAITLAVGVVTVALCARSSLCRRLYLARRGARGLQGVPLRQREQIELDRCAQIGNRSTGAAGVYRSHFS